MGVFGKERNKIIEKLQFENIMLLSWITDNSIELFGAITGIVYVILEIRQVPLLWPVGIVTSAVYIWVFFTARLYADMSLQVYYVVISFLGWYWWVKGAVQGDVKDQVTNILQVTHIKLKLAVKLAVILIVIYTVIYLVLSRLTDSPVPSLDAFITSLSIIGTWMLARKIYEHWFLWIIVNSASIVLCLMRELYPTAGLYSVYLIMSFIGLYHWRKSIS
jgi:nicotinamide mononucleotide transporter